MKKKIIVVLFITLIISIIIMITLKSIAKKRDLTVATEIANEYIETRYGKAGNFEIIDVALYEDDLFNFCFAQCGPDRYVFKIRTSYMEKHFEVQVAKTDKEIISDNFIILLAKEKWKIESNLNHYINELVVTDIQQTKYNNEINFSTIFDVNSDDAIFESDIMYGKLPTIADLKSNSKIEFNYINITKVFTTKDEVIDYIKGLYDYYFREWKKYNGESYKMEFAFQNETSFDEYSDNLKKAYAELKNNDLYIYLFSNPIVISNYYQ